MKKRYILFLVPFFLYVAILGILPQMEPDESRYSLIASAMNETGNFVTPHIKHTIYLEKPPLASWITAIFFMIFGENDFSARLFSGLSAWGCILLTFFIGRHFRDEKTGLYAAAVLTVSVFPFILGRINILDMPLAFFLCLAVWLGYLSLTKERKKYFSWFFYGCCALAFLTKGIIGVVFPFAILGLWLVWAGRWRAIPQLLSPGGIVIFLLIVLPWIYLAHKENTDFLYFFFVREHFLRFTTKMHGKTEPFYYFAPIIIGGCLPWLACLIRAWQPQRWKESLFSKEENKLLAAWFLFIFLFFTVSSSKVATYMAPVFIPLALFAGSIFRNYEDTRPAFSGKRKLFYRRALYGQAFLIAAALLIPLVLLHYHDPSRGLVIMISSCWWIYILPSLLAASLLVFLPDWIDKKKGAGWFLTIYLLCALFLAGMILPLNDFLFPYRSARAAKEAIARHVPAGQLLYQYRVNFYGIDFYNKIRTPIVEDFGEMGDGIMKLTPEERAIYFFTVEEFFKKVKREKEIYCITQHQEKVRQLRTEFPETDILWENGAFYLLRIEN